MRTSLTLASIAIATGANAWGAAQCFSQKWALANFTSLVAFGDSYTDDSRLGYFISHNGSAPPVGYNNPVSYHAADGGRTWVEYVKQYTGANLYNYAVSGAVCSNSITPRWFSAINAPFPDIAGYELPAYLNDSQYYYPNGTKFMNNPSDGTVYAIWIGTNDLGYAALIQDEQVAGTNITTYVDCVYDQLSRVYANGGRFFVILNVAPLNLAPEYGIPGQGGVGPNQYWPDKSGNLTEISERMLEQVVTVNSIYDYRTPFEVEIARRYPGASFAVFNVHDLMQDIHDNPTVYLNGTAPLNVTGVVNACNATGGNCVASPSPDSFMWYDELHPSEQVERVVARTFVDVVSGVSSFATYWSS
ncbi:carbohydrate esterase family 16 protein [Baudoinia panamericana UAMH 10762]|uniref:Carbohydrate esterase family 16 protein n=1 Tax=Baudoinia panamericana (strain UAMH 10762) TaxID=717646 RepID=M2LGK6_BAUPA|nr:carbohydrate esterase family 16 protein [Baudoinia panamericana UAMH 10762]EMC93212.1 carbohydrate esterase family 16 protein [Baudoinia panamericana UAMH 10762]